MMGCKPMETSMNPNVKLGEVQEGDPVDQGRYRELVRRLIYLSHTRLNIAYAVSVLS